MYYIYHIPEYIHKTGQVGKIGVTKYIDGSSRRESLKKAEKEGWKWEVLETHTDINVVSRREKELQVEYGYLEDRVSYYRMAVVNNKKATTPEAVKKRAAKQSISMKGNKNAAGNKNAYNSRWSMIYRELTTGKQGQWSDMVAYFGSKDIGTYAKLGRPVSKGKCKGLHFVIVED